MWILSRGERRDKPPTGCRSTAVLTQKDKTVSHMASLETPNLHVFGPWERPQERTRPGTETTCELHTEGALMEAQCIVFYTFNDVN